MFPYLVLNTSLLLVVLGIMPYTLVAAYMGWESLSVERWIMRFCTSVLVSLVLLLTLVDMDERMTALYRWYSMYWVLVLAATPYVWKPNFRRR